MYTLQNQSMIPRRRSSVGVSFGELLGSLAVLRRLIVSLAVLRRLIVSLALCGRFGVSLDLSSKMNLSTATSLSGPWLSSTESIDDPSSTLIRQRLCRWTPRFSRCPSMTHHVWRTQPLS
ncbi:hypothetical protein F2Q68_00012266 [Brassica cretica]|uniref:Uncharacterized protein n=1 Tax=Brassica cretica TaxID=69181 RepID=A0A3N6Q3Y4_BRACR|nr:hypothetical protein F2Q68_00012266 [Brassica cretica]